MVIVGGCVSFGTKCLGTWRVEQETTLRTKTALLMSRRYGLSLHQACLHCVAISTCKSCKRSGASDHGHVCEGANSQRTCLLPIVAQEHCVKARQTCRNRVR